MDRRIIMTVNDGVAEVVLNRPEKMNALDLAQFRAIADVIAEIGARRDIRCVVLAGSGRAFCSGIDLSLMDDKTALGSLETRTHGEANLFQQAAWGWRTLPVPVIAAVHGYAFGAGCQLMLGADIRVAAPDAEVSMMEMRWGLVPDMAGIALLRGLVRDDHARDIVFTGRRIAAEEAVAIGLLTRIAANPLATARETAAGIAASSPDAVRAAKRLLNALPEHGAAEILISEAREQQALLAGGNHHEAVAAGMARRAPRFQDQADTP